MSPRGERELLFKGMPRFKLMLLAQGELWKRKRFVQEADFQKGYAFRSWSNDPERNLRLWILHSPDERLSRDVSVFQETAANLLSMKEEKENKILFSIVHKPLSDAYYLEIPEAFSGGRLVYLSVVEASPKIYGEVKLGALFLLGRRSLSKRILLLSEGLLEEVRASSLPSLSETDTMQ